MRTLFYQLALLLLLVKECLSYGYLYSTKKWFQSGKANIISGDIDGWTLTNSNAYYTKCTGKVTELNNRDLFTLRSYNTISRSYTSLPPHWSVGVRMDLVITSGTATLTINTSPYYFNWYSYGNSYPVCSSTSQNFQRVYQNATHTSSTLSLTLTSNSDLIMGFVEIYLDRCHDSCIKCSGPSSSQCTACDASASLSSGVCKCAAGKYLLGSVCYNPCPNGYIINPDTTQQTCVTDYCYTGPENIYCSTCKTSSYCTTCKVGYYFYRGLCVSQCPPEAPKDSTGVCQDPTVGKWNAKYLVYELFSDTFNESDIVGANFSIASNSARFYSNSYWTKFTDCGQYRFFAGYNVYGPTSEILYQFTLPAGAKYSSFLVSFLFGQIDNYETGEYVNFQITNSAGVQMKYASITGNGKDLICGRNDQQELFQYQYLNVSVTTPDTYKLKINNTLGQIENESYGMREFIVIVDYCIENCTKCESAAGCTQCDAGYYLYKSQCYKDRCPDGSFEDKTKTTPRYCSSCHESCKTCSAGLSTNCITCFDGIYFRNGSCVANCGDQFYPTTLTCTSCQALVCQPCYAPCLRCTSGAYNQCQACISGYYLDSDKSECVSVCQDRFYPNPSTNTCDPCDVECFNCNGPNNNQCIQCELPRFLFGTECRLSCPSGYFGNKKNSKCEPCTSPCAECVDVATKCTKCNLSNLYLDDFTCVYNCSDKKYKDTATMRCEKCNTLCGNCTGPYSNQCTSCDFDDGFLLGTSCVQDCGDGYFPISSPSYICGQCHKSCKTCVSPGDNMSCTSCNSQYLNPQGQCLDDCPVHYYKDPSNYLCKKCNETCLTCSDQYSISCLTCDTGRYFLKGLCVTICPSNTFPLDLKGCEPCHPSCATCTGYLLQNCSSCKLGNYLYNGQCLTVCPKGYYGSNETGLCSPCHPYCASCYGKEVYECYTCNTNYSLSGSTCGNSCPIGQYQDPALNQCANCHFECYTCNQSTKNDCTGCKGERYLDLQAHFCDTQCAEKTYKGANNICQPCHPSCANCTGPSISECNQCSQGRYLYEQTCVLACPQGYFSSEQPYLCNKCHPSCTQCQFGAQDSDCTSCSGNYYLDGAKCVLTCPKGSFGNVAPNVCLLCNSSCAECSGPNYNECTTCQDKSYRFQSQCHSTCPTGYIASDINKECIQCGAGCNSCTVADPELCLSCNIGQFLHQNSCQSVCPDGTYVGDPSVTNPNRRQLGSGDIIENPNPSTQICLNCADDCRKCTGSLKNDCNEWFDDRVVTYSDYLIFWIFLGKTIFCFVGVLVGFYLDYRDEKKIFEKEYTAVNQQGQEEEQKHINQQNMNQVHPMDKQTSQAVLLGATGNGLIPLSSNSPEKSHNILNDMETVKSYQKHDEIGNALDHNNTKNKRSRNDIKHFQNNSLKVNNLNKNTETHGENDIKILDPDLFFQGNNNTLNTQQNAKFSTNKFNFNEGTKLHEDDYNLNNILGGLEQNANNNEQPNETQTMQKSPILAFFNFFEITHLFVYQNVQLMRPVRVLVYYSKLLFIFLITSKYVNLEYYLIGLSMVGLLFVVKFINKLILYVGRKFQTLIMLCFGVQIVLIFLHVKMFFFPEIARISFPQDLNWSYLYLYVFAAELGVFQIMYLIVQIVITYDFSTQHILKYDIFHKILHLFCFKDLLKKWLDEK